MSENERTITIPEHIYVNFTLSECELSEFDGEYKNIKINLKNLTGDDILAYGVRNMVVRIQTVRNSKDKEKYAFLTKGEIDMPKPGNRISKSPEKIAEEAEALLEKLSPEMRALLMAKYGAAV